MISRPLFPILLRFGLLQRATLTNVELIKAIALQLCPLSVVFFISFKKPYFRHCIEQLNEPNKFARFHKIKLKNDNVNSNRPLRTVHVPFKTIKNYLFF